MVARRHSAAAAIVGCEDGRRYSHVVGCEPVPGFLRAAMTPGGQVANPTFLDSLYTYAWFVTFGLSFVLYLLLARKDRA